ncbi:hypothetical protein CLS_16690 [[Clostridium] cf. saccharolyticum K10]|nr:hypothetical protein CLS_16690 [[Clostridium] cf. saccharolyticum K10]
MKSAEIPKNSTGLPLFRFTETLSMDSGRKSSVCSMEIKKMPEKKQTKQNRKREERRWSFRRYLGKK